MSRSNQTAAAAAKAGRSAKKSSKAKVKKAAAPNTKLKKKKNSSEYGRISVQRQQQPKSTKWNLPASMGGASGASRAGGRAGKQSKKSQKKVSGKSKNRKGSIGDKTRNNTKSHKKFVLNMPVVSQSNPVVPWLLPQKVVDETPLSRKRQPTVQLGHKSLTIPAASLDKLNEELEAFAKYVRLNENEIAARRSVVKHIQTQCCDLFGVSPETCKVFGSFASLPVCNFTSDVDMAIHDVVPAPATWKNTANRAKPSKDIDDDDATPKRATTKRELRPPHPNLKRQERILKWKAALDEAEEKKKDESTTSASVGTSAAQPIVILEEISSSSPAKRRPPQELVKSIPLPASAEKNHEGLPLFVIDRAGCPDDDNMGDDLQVSVPPQTKGAETTMAVTFKADAPTVTDTSSSIDPSILDDVDENVESESSEPLVEPETAVGHHLACSKTTERASRLEDSEDEDSVQQHDDSGQGSDADSADKLAALKDRLKAPNAVGEDRTIRGNSDHDAEEEGSLSHDDDDDDDDDDHDDDYEEEENDVEEAEQDEKLKAETRPRSRSIISLCSATTCSDTEENKDWDDSGMEVSFHSKKTAFGRKDEERVESSMGPTGKTRTEVVGALYRLSQRLRGRLTGQIHVRKWARVPIINMETRFGFECDIAIGGHNGVDTSSFASSQVSRFESFSTVVLVLKILLYQHDLDKPFTGGLGSFKLYVLVASHIEKHLQLGGNDNAAEIFITFLLRYGVPNLNSSASNLLTRLRNDTVISTTKQGFAVGVADMGGVYKLDDCLLVFQACYHKLRDKLQNCSTDPSHSILGYIVDSQWLKSVREKDMINHGGSTHSTVALEKRSSNASALAPGLRHFTGTDNDRPHHAESRPSKRKAVAKVNCQETASKQAGRKRLWEECAVDTDDEAEQLKAGYGLQGVATQRRHSKPPGSSTKKTRGTRRHNQN